MQPLEALIAEAEVSRVLQICNACRYCEGFCAVFPAMARRLEFPPQDAHYLANLCHNCGACLHACQYAPPHEFAVNVPAAMAKVRGRTYEQYAWPAAFGAAYRRNGLVLALALVAGLALFLGLASKVNGTSALGNGFYAIFPHGLMVSMFLPVFAFAVLALAIGIARFWRDAAPGAASGPAVAEAAHDALTLRYLDGGHGQGCNEETDRFTRERRMAHHATFYGFVLCFASTSVGTIYHYALGWSAPYGWLTLPKGLGTAGGVLLVLGCAGLLRLRLKRHARHQLAEQKPMDVAFVSLLGLTGLSGLLLAAARDSAAMPPLLCLHLGAVLALFVTLPYGKFAHAGYRVAALLKWAIEKRRPLALKLGGE